jgi:putative acyl-CoA dehydrogenase
MVLMLSQVDPGVCCPLTMTYAGIAALAAAERPDDWRHALMSRDYDDRILPVSAKRGATLGMAMTEKQGGSDLRTNTTRARRDGDAWWLDGHKWFCSAPMSDGFLTLAQAPEGLTCFLVPRWLPDGTRNGVRLLRLKEKLGNRSNASAEIEYQNAFAHQIGEAGDGVRTIIQMVHHTRLDTAMAPAGLMRAALAEAHRWAEGRTAFQRRLIDQPLMRAVLADLTLDLEGATALGLRIARAFDEASPLARIGVALAKYLSNKVTPGVIYEAMEALGGMGYTDDTPLPMLFRESPLNSIWEGSGNVICLDILRSRERDTAGRAALEQELDAAKGADRGYDAALAAHNNRWGRTVPEAEARWFAESAATLLTASVLIRSGVPEVADAYAATRLGELRGRTAGAMAEREAGALLARLG